MRGLYYMRFEDLTKQELLQSMEAEVAKSLSELSHAQEDIDKANNRLKFILAIIHHIKED